MKYQKTDDTNSLEMIKTVAGPVLYKQIGFLLKTYGYEQYIKALDREVESLDVIISRAFDCTTRAEDEIEIKLCLSQAITDAYLLGQTTQDAQSADAQSGPVELNQLQPI